MAQTLKNVLISKFAHFYTHIILDFMRKCFSPKNSDLFSESIWSFSESIWYVTQIIHTYSQVFNLCCTIVTPKINNIEFPEHYDINKILIGDLAISLEYIKNQSENKRIIFDNEIKKLIIHGILHLNGYDHENIKDEKKMTEKQNYILNQI